MSTLSDPLVRPSAPEHGPDRLNFALGRMLDADDLAEEQLYHRGRLARALAYVVGEGTLAGLDVGHPAESIENPSDEERARDDLVVRPGLAIDRLGRLVEVLEPYCIRLDRWYDQHSADDQRDAFAAENGGPTGRVRADLFLEFRSCERGRTPAFASGPYDAIDAFVANRIRDAHQLRLVLRQPGDELPVVGVRGVRAPYEEGALRWPTLDSLGGPAGVREWIVKHAWREGSDAWDAAGPSRPVGWPSDVDPAAVFLARLSLRASRLDADGAGERRIVRAGSGQGSFEVDQAGRLFAVPSGALLQWLIELRTA